MLSEVERVHLLGYHTGSMVAVEATEQRPDRVLSIVSISAPLFTDEESQQLDARFAPIPIDENGTRFTRMWERVLQHQGPGSTLQMAAASFAENLRAGDNYEWGHRAAFAYAAKYRQRIQNIQQPMLVLNPKDDCYEQSKRADPLMRHGTRRDFPQWGPQFPERFSARRGRCRSRVY